MKKLEQVALGMAERAEWEIMQKWIGDIDNPLVSVCCTTYNYEYYVEEAIEGFLMEETDFLFEIIVRDYTERYPSLIKPIYEKENQYSKGIWAISRNRKNIALSYTKSMDEMADFINQKYREEIDRKISIYLFHLALLCLDNDLDSDFREMIDRSYRSGNPISLLQVLLYYFLFTPSMAKQIIKFKKISAIHRFYSGLKKSNIARESIDYLRCL